MLMDSVTVLLHRLGVAYKAIMNPVLRVRRSPTGELLDIRPPSEADDSQTASTRPGSTFSCPVRSTAKALAEAERLLPSVLADARQVALDSRALTATLLGLAERTRRRLRRDVSPARTARTSPRCCAGLPTGTSCCWAISVARCSDGQSSVDTSSRLGVLRLRQEILPQLTDSDDLLVLAQATIPSFLRYGAYPYIVVVREHPGRQAVEHRFVGLFTVAAMNANVLDIPLISRRVSEALAMAAA